MNKLKAIYQYNRWLHDRRNTPFANDQGWDGTNGPYSMYQVREDQDGHYSGRMVAGRPSFDTYREEEPGSHWDISHATKFKLELHYE